MPFVDAEINGKRAFSKEAKLNLKHLPGFAKFLLEERLEEFSAELIRLSRAVNLPIMKYFDFMADEKLIEITKEGYAPFLGHLINNTMDAYLEEVLQKWKQDQLPLITREQIVVDDITLGTFVRRRAFTRFIPEYTQDVKFSIEIINELEEFLLKAEASSFELYISIQQETITRNSESLEEKNRELERSNKELTAFSYVASHDLQEPLRKIKLFINLLTERESQTMSENSQRMFSKIHNSVTRMQKLIDDLLSFSRVNQNQDWEQVDLNLVLNELKYQYRDQLEAKSLVLETSDMPVLRGAAFQFYQLFDNMVSNSIKYSREGVRPHVRIANEVVPGSNLEMEGVDRAKKYYRISIADNGIGFEQKNADKIFEIFQRLHGRDEYSGTGIGLAICKKIVQGYKGFIYAQGEIDKGSTFFICIPES